ncbi:MAG: arginase [Ignavibacteriales bacterium]|nr:arginase [Ignavibacteriales bacterium]
MKIHVLGVPMDLGAGRRGVDMGPSAIRIAGVTEQLRALDHLVYDEGDILTKNPELQRIRNDKLKYLPEIVRVCTLLAAKVEKIMQAGGFPIILGGDHSVALGTIAGISSYARKSRKSAGVLWVDAHGDLNTDATTPSGNIHGMPLAASLGLGAIELTSIGGDHPKIDPKNIVLIATRELDEGERMLIKQHRITVYTMEEIDKYGMSVIISKALRKLKGVELLHVSFDLDAVDPSVAPGVGTPVKGGLNYREAHLIMETLNEQKAMTSLEIVEVNPILDNRNQSAEFAVELIQSALGKKIL